MKTWALRSVFTVCFVIMLAFWTVCVPLMCIGGAGIGMYRGLKLSGYSGRRGYVQIIKGFRENWGKLNGR